MSDLSFFAGRKLLKSELPLRKQRLLKDPRISRYPTMEEDGPFIKCLRCSSRHLKSQVQIITSKEAYFYCPTCIQLGRVQSNQSFYGCQAEPSVNSDDISLKWQGTLSHNQQMASQKIVESMANNQHLLIDAVTGAGKTEMLFAGIYDSLKKGKRVCIASPRTDVCLELYPRLAKAFPDLGISLLYGKQTETYFDTPFVICTTHQLLRFYQAFDVMIIDEVDAFPYVNNSMLAYGVSQAQKVTNSLIYLSATPTNQLRRQVNQGTLKYHQVPVRYHGKPLPVPQGQWVWQWQQKINSKKLPRKIAKLIRNQLLSERRTLIFCPTIATVEQLVMILQKTFPKKKIAAVHAKDLERYEKVSQMREQAYDLLLTTTILERGVTFEAIDVIVIGSNHHVFNQAALIQIAGRVGRSANHYQGRIWLIHDGWTKEMRRCCQIISQTNRQVERKGLLKK